MENIQQHIAHFISNQSLASVCCMGPENELHCFTCYFAYNDKLQLLLFKSSDNSLHTKFLLQNPVLAGTILPDKHNKFYSKGIQFNGRILPLSHPQANDASKFYHKKFPFALTMKGTVYSIRLDRIKMTDNTMGIGTKLIWDRKHSPQLSA